MNGFLPTRGSIMLDAVALAMIVVVAVLPVSIYLVKQKKYVAHKRIQTAISIALLVAILAFEVDMRFFSDWRELAGPSQFYDSGIVNVSLIVHLCFAVPTPFVWGFVLIRAHRLFSKPPKPGSHSRPHKAVAWIAVVLMVLTSITGWVFYLLAFVW